MSDEPTPTLTTPHRKREYPRGQSPFCSPKAGDVLITSNGDLREVIEVSLLGGVSYDLLKRDATHIHEPEPIGRGAWAAWCSRTQASLLARNVAGYLEIERTKRLAERELASPAA
jgi:hypothetical protein